MAVIGIGRHAVKVVSHQIGKSGTGTPHVAVLFEDAGGDRITWYGYLTDKALESTLKALGNLGWDAGAHDGRIDSLHGTELLVGADAEVVVEAEEYQGNVQYKVRWVNEPGGGLGERMPADEALGLAAELRQKILSAKGPTPSAKPAPSRQPVPALADPDDSLPF